MRGYLYDSSSIFTYIKYLVMAHLRVGLALLLMTLMIIVLMITSTPKLLNHFGIKRILVTGLGLMASGISITPSRDEGCYAVSEIVTTKIFIAYVLPASLISVLAMSLAYIPIMTTAIPSARTEQIVLASGLVNTRYQIGSALGLAVIVNITSNQTIAIENLDLTNVAASGTGIHVAFLVAVFA